MKSFCYEDKKKKINGDDSAKIIEKKSSTDNFVHRSEANLHKSQIFVKKSGQKSEENLSIGHDNVKHHAMLQANQAHLKNSHLINGRQHCKSQQLVNSLSSLFADGRKSTLEQRKSQLEKLSLQYVLSKGKFSQNLFFMSFFFIFEGEEKFKIIAVIVAIKPT